MKQLPKILILTLMLAGCGKQSPQTATQLGSADLNAGKTIVAEKCVGCHGTDGMSRGPDIPNLTGQKGEYLYAALMEYKKGARYHVALNQLMTTLNEQDTKNVAAYFASLKMPATAQGSANAGDRVAAGQKAAANCTSCHGTDGNATAKGTPSLAGQHPDYLINAMHAYAEGIRADNHMTTRTSTLHQSELENIALFFASQESKSRQAVANAAKGEALAAKCGGCHGQQGHSADANKPSLAGQDATYLAKTMKDYRSGKRPHDEMKAQLANMKDADLDLIAAFYASQKPQKAQLATPTSGKAWAERCDKCHGPSAHNSSLLVPYIESQPVNYLTNALKAYRAGGRPEMAMHTMGTPLTDADIEAVSRYYNALPRR